MAVGRSRREPLEMTEIGFSRGAAVSKGQWDRQASRLSGSGARREGRRIAGQIERPFEDDSRGDLTKRTVPNDPRPLARSQVGSGPTGC